MLKRFMHAWRNVVPARKSAWINSIKILNLHLNQDPDQDPDPDPDPDQDPDQDQDQDPESQKDQNDPAENPLKNLPWVRSRGNYGRMPNV